MCCQKVVTPASRKLVVTHMKVEHHVSERTACQLVGLSRSGYRYLSKPNADRGLKTRLGELATQYPRYGYLILHSLLKQEGLMINKKTYVPPIYTEGGLKSSYQEA